jgi:hypothetical protein
MYSTVVDNTPLIKVIGGKHEANYSLDGSLMNPLEAFYAALAACAAVYAKKACKSLGIRWRHRNQLQTLCRPRRPADTGQVPRLKFASRGFTPTRKAAVLESISIAPSRKSSRTSAAANKKTGARPGFAFLADNQAAMPSSNCCNSPVWYISFMMSQPPMNSPLM